jgi:CheY-like chemotaxis protein/HPt (histidine-containing phosphotransfer) domain-containing protein
VKPIKQSELLDAIMSALGAQQEAAAYDLPPAFEARPLRFLLAEDNLVNQRVARTILEKQGHEVVVAQNGREALARAQTERFDVILMDVQMPEMDGLAATTAIRQFEAGRGHRVPIIGVTAHAMKGDRERCLAAGMDAYVSKPIRPAVLFAAITDLVNNRPADPAPPAADPAPTGVVLDESALLALIGGDAVLLRELAALFLQDGPQRLAEMAKALESADRTSLEREAHTLKGSSGSLCGRRTAEAARNLEHLAQEGSLQEAGRAYAVLSEEVHKLQGALTDLAARNAA